MHKLHLPRFGQTMESGTVRRWLKEPGEQYEIGDPLYEVETEKTSLEVEAKLPGRLVRLVAELGTELPVGALLAVVADPGESPSEAAIDAEAEAEVIREREEKRPGRVRAVPRARALAGELGVDLGVVKPSARDGTITVEDVRRAASGRARVRELRRLSGVARAMAEAVTRSWSVPQFVQIALVDAGTLLDRRRREGVSVTDLLIEAIVQGVAEVPEVNAIYEAGGTMVIYEDVNVSVATSTDRGLLLPVLRRAQALSLTERAAALRELLERAREGRSALDDTSGGTITVSNLGMAGVETGTPLLTPGQAALVFAGSVEDRPVAVEGSLQVRPTLYLSVAYDHRIVDGALGARFTTALKRCVEGGRRNRWLSR